MAKIVIVVRGGVVQEVYTDCVTTEIITLDRDIEGYPPAMIGTVLDAKCCIPCLNRHGVYRPDLVAQADKESDKFLGEPEEVSK